MTITCAREDLNTTETGLSTESVPSLKDYLARSRTAADSADSALFDAVAAQAVAAHDVVSAVVERAGISRTASLAATPSVEGEAPHAEPVPTRVASVTGLSWPGSATVDPSAWLAGQLDRFSGGDAVDPYAELMLRRAGFAPAPR